MHVDVTRPRQTDTEGFKVPIVYQSIPTSRARRRIAYASVERESGTGRRAPAARIAAVIKFQPERANVSNSQVNDVGAARIRRRALGGAGHRALAGMPDRGRRAEGLAPKAVIDWLNGRAKGYTTIDGTEEVRDVLVHRQGRDDRHVVQRHVRSPPRRPASQGLEAIIPVAPNTSYYHYYRSNGLVRHPGGWLGEDIDFLYDFINSGIPARRDELQRELSRRRVRGGRDRTTGDYNDFLGGARLLTQVEATSRPPC